MTTPQESSRSRSRSRSRGRSQTRSSGKDNDTGNSTTKATRSKSKSKSKPKADNLTGEKHQTDATGMNGNKSAQPVNASISPLKKATNGRDQISSITRSSPRLRKMDNPVVGAAEDSNDTNEASKARSKATKAKLPTPSSPKKKKKLIQKSPSAAAAATVAATDSSALPPTVGEVENDSMKAEIEKPTVKALAPTPQQNGMTKSSMAKKKSSTTMDVKVHRIRHLDYIPSPVLALAAYESYTAVSRQDGSIELYDTTFYPDYKHSKKWSPHVFPLATISGSKHAVAHSLVFCPRRNDNADNAMREAIVDEEGVLPTLVAGSPDGTLWTVSFSGASSPKAKGGNQRQLQSRIPSGGGAVLDLATCCAATNMPLVASACQDGSVRIWKVNVKEDGSNLPSIDDTPVAILATTGAPLLSLAWRLEKQVGDKLTTHLYAAVADGTIRKFQVELHGKHDDTSGGSISVSRHTPQLRMTVESRGRRTATKVWSMKALEDGSLVTGNSLGQIQIWDTRTGTLKQSMQQTELKADVLAVTVNADESKIFASGVDSRVVCLERRNNQAKNKKMKQQQSNASGLWKFVNAQRPHTHDVKALTIVRGPAGTDGRYLEALVSAGVDTKLCSYIVSDFPRKRPQVYYPWPSQSPVSSTKEYVSSNADQSMEKRRNPRLLAIHRANQIEIYRLDQREVTINHKRKKAFRTSSSPDADIDAANKSTSELIGEIALQTQSNLSLSLISPNGEWLAAANATNIFLFRLYKKEATSSADDSSKMMNIDTSDLEPIKFSLQKNLSKVTATAMHFSENGSSLFVTDLNQRLFVVDLLSHQDQRVSSTVTMAPLESKTMLPIVSIKTRQTNLHQEESTEWVVTMAKQHIDGINVYRRKKKGNTDIVSHYWTLPSLAGVRPAAVALIGTSELAVATSSFQLYIFDLEKKQLNPWSERNGFPITYWPPEVTFRKDFPLRLFVNPKDENQLIMASFGVFVVFNLKGLVPQHCRMIPESHVRRKRRRNEEGLAAAAERATPIIFAPAKDRYHGQPKFKAGPETPNCTVCLNYTSMLHFDYLGTNEMIVVEQPWLRVISTFPEALQRRVYGCS